VKREARRTHPDLASRFTLRIGVISDTHGFLDPKVGRLFAGVGHILHAGDIGPQSLLLELEAIAPVTAVLGNTDTWLNLGLTESIVLDGRKFLVHHIVDPRGLGDDLKARIASEQTDVVVFGHTHRSFCEVIGGVLFLNPGCAGKQRSEHERSVAILQCDEDGIRPQFLNL
jgi:putative phosphoesterase